LQRPDPKYPAADGFTIGAQSRPRASVGFIALYTLANVGAFIAFIPLLQILVPLRATAIDPAHNAILLSRVALCGAVTASLANIAFGALSDRTHGAAAGRRPWLMAGLAGVLLSYAVIRQAGTAWALLGGTVLFQLAFNAMFAPLSAVLADKVSAAQRGLMSALLGLGYPVGNLIGTQVVGHAVMGETGRFMALGVLVAALIVPFVLCVGNAASPAGAAASWRMGMLINPLTHRNFSCALIGRVLVVTSFSVVQGYLLLYLHHLATRPAVVSGSPEAGFAELATITAFASGACALIGGAALDRFQHGTGFVFASAVGVAVGITVLACARSWLGLQLGSLVYGGASGVFHAVDLALIVQVLPSLHSAGKDLGIVNLSNTIPQAIAPLIALAVLTETTESFRLIFLLGAATALLGGLCILAIRTGAPKRR
jgi:MFS family permease